MSLNKLNREIIVGPCRLCSEYDAIYIYRTLTRCATLFLRHRKSVIYRFIYFIFIWQMLVCQLLKFFCCLCTIAHIMCVRVCVRVYILRHYFLHIYSYIHFSVYIDLNFCMNKNTCTDGNALKLQHFSLFRVLLQDDNTMCNLMMDSVVFRFSTNHIVHTPRQIPITKIVICSWFLVSSPWPIFKYTVFTI